MCSRLKQRASKSACFVVPPLFRADSGTNLIKHGENVKGRPYGSVAQWAECLHGKREALGRVPFGPRCYPPLVTQTFSNLKVNTYNQNLPLPTFSQREKLLCLSLLHWIGKLLLIMVYFVRKEFAPHGGNSFLVVNLNLRFLQE